MSNHQRIALLSALLALLAACSGSSKDLTEPPAHSESATSLVGGAYLEITLQIDPSQRMAAADVYTQYKQPFLETIDGAVSKELLLRGEDVQVLHRFETQAQAKAYLNSTLFNDDVVVGLKPYLTHTPGIRVYERFPIEEPGTHRSKAYLQITLKVDADERTSAAQVYSKYREPFLETISGAESKDLVIRSEDVQVLHGFSSVQAAQEYLESPLLQQDVVVGLKPYLKANPEVRVYESVGGE